MGLVRLRKDAPLTSPSTQLQRKRINQFKSQKNMWVVVVLFKNHASTSKIHTIRVPEKHEKSSVTHVVTRDPWESHS